MSHLGSRVAALVDGELAPDVAARAHAHAAACPPCLRALEAERRTRALLVGAAEPPVPDGLMAALLAMGGPDGPLPPRSGHLPGTPRPRTLGFAEPLGGPPVTGRPDAGPGRARVRRVVTRVRARSHPGSDSAVVELSGSGTGPRGPRSGTGPGRLVRGGLARAGLARGGLVRNRLTVVAVGSVSLASVGLLSFASLSGVLDDDGGGAGSLTTQLTVDRQAGTRSAVLPTPRPAPTSTAVPVPAVVVPATVPAATVPGATVPAVTVPSASARGGQPVGSGRP